MKDLRSDRRIFDIFTHFIKIYFEIKAQHQAEHQIYYEDILTHGPEQILFNLGLTQKMTTLTWKEEVMNGPTKEMLFQNLDEMKAWYQESPLQILSPLDKYSKF